jgi:molybdopterin-containing oxidoreductase family iron-sulfur binding subunit
VLAATVNSPTTAAVIAEFLKGFKNGRLVSYDPVSSSAILDAHAQTHGARLLPHYRFDRADVIVGLDADFLGTWVSPVEFTRGYTAKRRVDERAPSRSFHAQIESRMSLTGSKADRRLRVAPGELGHVATHLVARVARKAGAPFPADGLTPSAHDGALDDLSERLWAARGRALVVSGSQDLRVQLLCNAVNQLLGAYGETIEIDRPSYQRAGSDTDLEQLRGELSRGEVAALIVAGVNPVFDLPGSSALARDLGRVPLLISTAERLDETATLAQYVCPDHHFLESWNDAEPVAGLVSLTQPTIQPLHDTRAFIETLSAWTSEMAQPAQDLIRDHWEKAIYPRAPKAESFQLFWEATLLKGVAQIAPRAAERRPAAASGAPQARAVLQPDAAPAGGFALVLYPNIGMLDGRQAHNAWLHELPDPVTKVTWDNCASLSPAAARRLGVVDGDIVRITADDVALELPAFVQPGQHDSAVGVAIGYGRSGTDRFARVGPVWLEARPLAGLVGVNAAPFVTTVEGVRRFDGRGVAVAKTGRHRDLASTQLHSSLTTPPELPDTAGPEPRPIIRETTLDELRAPAAPRTHDGEEPHELWPDDHPFPVHHWGMAIDLDACTGCSACVVSCQVENNVPVVGQDEVRRKRQMHWIRIDRYYSGTDEQVEVAHQPMLCQHCEHAPCETVCPVLATVHSEEGLNEQVYNRCVGTRYCANNCPYKVRRFNWFDYPHEDRLQNLVLNPNVSVRSRGVMEKCSLCVQRIENAKVEARRTGQPLADGTIQTACQQACPAEAIVFGDLNDPKSRVSQLAHGRRAYDVLEELNTKPSIHYLKIVRQAPSGSSPASGGGRRG